MNDFTKEELKEMLVLIHDRRNSLADFLPINALVLKINRLIETYDKPEYCEHSGVRLDKCIHLWVRGKCHDCGVEKEECKHDGSVSKAIDNIGLGRYVGECQHESDGKAYTVSCLSEVDISKCVKCGEFYR